MKTLKKLLYCSISIFFALWFYQPLTGQELVHQFVEAYSSPLDGKYGREAVFQDRLIWEIATGNWEKPSPEEGNSDGKIIWKALSANEKGLFSDRDLRGGYLFCEYGSGKSQILILEASGHNEVYVNGEPRGGDVYSYGWVQHPVKLKRGKNFLLFRGARGQISARLSKPAAEIFLSERDALLPDLLEGDENMVYGAVRLINASEKELIGLQIVGVLNGKAGLPTEIPPTGPLTSRKIPFEISSTGFSQGDEIKLEFRILDSSGREVNIGGSPEFEISCKGPSGKRKETFISSIDGSVQYYSIVPSTGNNQNTKALFLSLHGASVEAVNQAAAYSPKDWGILVAPTNRRPYGFDWEDWGRMDALEVLNIVREKYRPDPGRLYLTGHSMGGHGTWHFGVTYPGFWAAIAPSAGWYSFWSYAGKEENEEPTKMEEVLIRASNPSNTLALSHNYLQYGVYILHGDKDDNVPVSQARFMRGHLADFHPDFCYYERPGAGHWWGNECVDWPPLFDFFKNHEQLELQDLKEINFSTSCPGISAQSRFVTIWQQEQTLDISNIKVEQDIQNKKIIVNTENVLLLKLDLNHLQAGQPFQVICEQDSFKIDPGSIPEVFILKTKDGWQLSGQPSLDEKGPHRYGLFKEAFNNNVVFVYGTSGTKEENEWAANKARFDAETFWYRGNGAVDVITDKEYLRVGARSRNVILYGHSEMNLAWKTLLPHSPIIVKRGEINLGPESYAGDDLSACFVFPKNGEDNTSVGVIAGTGLSGMKSLIPNRYFVSGAGFPDFFVARTSMLIDGVDGIVAAGFFNQNWELQKGE